MSHKPLNKSSVAEVRCFNCGQVGHYASSCTKSKRTWGSCFSCGSLQHRIKDCPHKQPGGGVKEERVSDKTDTTTGILEPVPNVAPSYRVNADITVGTEELSLSPILDTGSPISLIISSFVPGHLIEKKLDNNFHGINNSILNSIGTFKTHLCCNDLKLEVTFRVVPDSTINCLCLLGRDFILNNDLSVTFDEEVRISKKGLNVISDIDKAENDIFFIDLSGTNDELDLDINSELHHEQFSKFKRCFENNYLHTVRPKLPATQYEMSIQIKSNSSPFFFRPRRLSFYEKEEVQKITQDLLEKGIIRKSSSEFSSPIVLVPRKPSGLRLCVDYRKLNQMTIRDNWPLPQIDDQIDLLRNKNYFTQLDLKDAFYHVNVNANSVKYTSFVTHNSQYEFLKMPFGLKNSPANFSRFRHLVFRDLIENNKICIYADDICIATTTFEENLDILNTVFELMTKNLLELNLKKCSFFRNKIQFLGYTISNNCVAPAHHNLDAIKNYPIPKNFKDIQSFLGLTSYFRRFIKNFALLAKPLYELLKKNVTFKFGEQELESFDTLKNLLISEPVLAIYDPKAETQLHCDASSHGFGSILLQRQTDGKFHPVFYFSKRTTPSESKLHSYELEMLCIINSLKRFRVYLQGIEFTIVTDCNSIKLAIQKKDINPRILRWTLELQNYCYTLEHRPSAQMTHADCLSRNSILILEDNTFERSLSIRQDKDEKICEIRDNLENAESKFFELRNGLVYRKTSKSLLLFYVPECMEHSVIKTYHDEVGHVGVNKTYELISRTYWFPSMKSKIKAYIGNCLKCISYSSATGKGEGFLHPIPKGNLPFQTIHIDHYGPLEKTRHQNKFILLVVDGFTKFVKIYPCSSTNTKQVIKHLQSYFNSYSRPTRIVSDRGSCFTSNEFKEFVNDNDIKHVLIATGVPRANGQAEVINKSINAMCSKLSDDVQKWDEVLSKIEYSINNTINRSTGFSPSMLLFGINQRGHIYDNVRDFLESQDDGERDLSLVRAEAAENICKSQEYNKQLYDKKHREPRKYEVGDYVMVVNTDVSAGSNKKLIPKYRGPYVVKSVLDKDRYVITDIDGFQVTQIPFEGIMACSRMKPWMSD